MTTFTANRIQVLYLHTLYFLVSIPLFIIYPVGIIKYTVDSVGQIFKVLNMQEMGNVLRQLQNISTELVAEWELLNDQVIQHCQKNDTLYKNVTNDEAA